MRLRFLATTLTSILLFVQVADAKIYFATGRNLNSNFIGPSFALLLNDRGSQSANFDIPSKGTVAITYSAECSIDAIGAWIEIDIVIDGVARGISKAKGDAFCSSKSDAFHSMTIAVDLTAGRHKVEILAATKGTVSAQGHIGDSSLVVFD